MRRAHEYRLLAQRPARPPPRRAPHRRPRGPRPEASWHRTSARLRPARCDRSAARAARRRTPAGRRWRCAGSAAVSGSCVRGRSVPRAGQVGREIGQVAAVRAAEAVDRLRVVADDGQADAVRTQVPDDVDLHLVDVLVLVDEDVVVAAGERGAERAVGEQGAPAQQDVVEVEQRPLALAEHVRAEQAEHRVDVRLDPGELFGDHVPRVPAGVHGARVDVEHRVGARHALRHRRRGRPRGGAGRSGHGRRTCRAPTARARGRASARAPRRRGSRPRGRSRRSACARRRAGRTSRPRAGSISSAARRVKVSSRIRSGRTPRSTSAATRATSVRVLPVPAPATITSGASPCVAAASCASSSPASQSGGRGDLADCRTCVRA